jgi:hypothetical protein
LSSLERTIENRTEWSSYDIPFIQIYTDYTESAPESDAPISRPRAAARSAVTSDALAVKPSSSPTSMLRGRTSPWLPRSRSATLGWLSVLDFRDFTDGFRPPHGRAMTTQITRNQRVQRSVDGEGALPCPSWSADVSFCGLRPRPRAIVSLSGGIYYFLPCFPCTFGSLDRKSSSRCFPASRNMSQYPSLRPPPISIQPFFTSPSR